MSKINQIQNAIKELDGGAFQKLADSYLKKKGYDYLVPLGSVIGANKVRKGTPDTLVILPNEKYVFAEHTTQQTGLFEKIQGDLHKCFDEAKTGVPVSKIQEVVFCHTSSLDAGELDQLRTLCEQRGVNLNIFDIGAISYDLLEKYPGIARDILGINIDSGQILTPDEFVEFYGRNRLATRLDTAFHFREDELNKIGDALKTCGLIIVQGKAGVGKTRLALECCERFSELHPEYQIACVFNRGPDMFDDLRVHFSAPGSFLILVDDANRMSKFEYIVQLIQHQREDQQIKVIATVRDYAVDKVRNATQTYGSLEEISIPPLTDEQIKQLAEKEFGILNNLYLDRIVRIAQGNPRIAIMAAEVAREKNTLESINDVSSLYERYFASIRQDLADLEAPLLLRAAGVVAFFRVLDRTNENLMKAIEQTFGIAPDALWDAIVRLHEMEICDLYEDEAARISDQVLGTYLFYLSFIKSGVLDFGVLLQAFFPDQRKRLIDAINPLLDTFDTTAVMDAMRPYVERLWKQLEQDGDGERLFQLVEMFWFLKQTDTLIYAREQVAALPTALVDFASLDFNAKGESPSHSILSILTSFRQVEDSSFRMALNIICDYFEKCPDQLPKLIYLCSETFCFHHQSYVHGYYVQQAAIDVLLERAQHCANQFFAKTFLAIAGKYLHTEFRTFESRSEHAITHITFRLAISPPLTKLRKTIWGELFRFYADERCMDDVLKVLQQYSAPSLDISVKEIVEQDAKDLLPFLSQAMSPQSFQHVLLVHAYLDKLENFGVAFEHGLREKFENDTYRLYKLLAFDLAEMRDDGLSYDEYAKLKKQRIHDHLAHYQLADYERLLTQCAEMKCTIKAGSHGLYKFQESLLEVFRELAGRNAELYFDVMKSYLVNGAGLEINPYPLVQSLINVCGAQKTYSLLIEPSWPDKQAWLFSYYCSLPKDEIGREQVEQLRALYRTSQTHELPYHLDFLLNYRKFSPDIVSIVTELLLDRASQEDAFSPSLNMLFNPHSEINTEITSHFYGRADLLKRAYFYNADGQQHSDYDGTTFNIILNLDSGFAEEYIDWMYSRKKWLTSYDDSRDYSFIWKRADYLELMHKVAEKIFGHEKEYSLFSYFQAFFGIRDGEENPKPVTPAQESFIFGLIESRHGDVTFMRFIFDLVSSLQTGTRIPYISRFLELNKSYEAFAELPLESGMSSWTGSKVPMLQRHIDYYQSLIALFDTVDFLRHKQHVEQIITRLREEMEREKKRDFVSD
jgi:hypothetical protein